jgi:hypothetical protein
MKTDECRINLKVSCREKEVVEALSRQCGMECEQFVRTLLFETGMLTNFTSTLSKVG